MKKEKINILFGNKLRYLRESQGYNQYEFATECQISEAYYGRIERGEHSVTIVKALLIAKTLGVSLMELFQGIDENL